MPRATLKQPTEQQARAWLGTVIFPMLSALRTELTLSRQRSWTFRCNRRDFEYFQSTRAMVAPVYHANLEQLLRYLPALEPLLKSHDASLSQLRSAAVQAVERIQAASWFQQIAASQKADDWRYFAEYTINGLEDLPGNYALSGFWNAHAKAFHEELSHNEPDIRKSLVTAGDSVAQAVAKLHMKLSELQADLSDRFGLPAVDPGGAALI